MLLPFALACFYLILPTDTLGNLGTSDCVVENCARVSGSNLVEIG